VTRAVDSLRQKLTPSVGRSTGLLGSASAPRADRREYLFLGVAAAAFFAYNVHHWWLAPGDDWSSIWVAAAMVAGGRADLLYSIKANRFTDVGDPAMWLHFAHLTGRPALGHPYVHEPGLAYALSPFAGPGSWSSSLHVLLVLNVLALLGIVWLVGRIWAPFLLRPAPFVVVLIVLSLSEPVRYGMWLGQTTPLIVFLTLAGVALAPRYPLLAGLVLALPVSIKLTPVLIAVYWIVDHRRKGKALIGLGAGLVALAAVQLILISGGVISDYVSALRHIQQTTTTGFSNQSLPAWLVDFGVKQPPGSYPTRIVPGWVGALSTAGLLVAVAVVLLRARRIRGLGWDAEHFAVAGLLTATLPFTSLSWTHYYLLLIVPAALLLGAARTARLSWPYVVVAALVALDMQPLAVNGPRNMATADNLVRAHLLAGIIALGAVLLLPDRSWNRQPVPMKPPLTSQENAKA
jgi:alpha-1,2-mannosyltransferase